MLTDWNSLVITVKGSVTSTYAAELLLQMKISAISFKNMIPGCAGLFFFGDRIRPHMKMNRKAQLMNYIIVEHNNDNVLIVRGMLL